MLPPIENELRRHGQALIAQAKIASAGGTGIAVRVVAPDVLSACMLDAADTIEHFRSTLTWRTIDTAPRDGTRFIAFEKSDEYQRYECWWQDDFSNWSGWQNDWDCEPQPTHWKPLDTEPSTS